MRGSGTRGFRCWGTEDALAREANAEHEWHEEFIPLRLSKHPWIKTNLTLPEHQSLHYRARLAEELRVPLYVKVTGFPKDADISVFFESAKFELWGTRHDSDDNWQNGVFTEQKPIPPGPVKLDKSGRWKETPIYVLDTFQANLILMTGALRSFNISKYSGTHYILENTIAQHQFRFCKHHSTVERIKQD